MKFERLETRNLLAAVSLVNSGSTLLIESGDSPFEEISVEDVGNQLRITDTQYKGVYESFENRPQNDTNFVVSDGRLSALFAGGVAGTRAFPPGYNSGIAPWITIGQSVISIEGSPDKITFFMKDVTEARIVNPAFANVRGTISLVGVNGAVADIEVPEIYTYFDSSDYLQEPVALIIINNLDSSGNPTGITNIDDFSLLRQVGQNVQNFAYVDSIFAMLGASNDTFFNRTGIRSTVTAGPGFNALFGGSARDFFVGGANRDYMAGGDGGDVLFGSFGQDALYGGAGNDFVLGGNDFDIMQGDDDSDIMVGGRGSDYQVGGGGLDTVFTDPDDETFRESNNLDPNQPIRNLVDLAILLFPDDEDDNFPLRGYFR